MKETAIAAYASLGCLSNLLDDVYDRIEIQYPALDAQPFDALRESVDFLLCKLQAHSGIKREKMKKIWWEIATVAHEVYDIIDAHVVNLLHKEERYMGQSAFFEDMKRINQMIHKIKTDLLIATEKGDDTQGKEDEGQDNDAEETVQAHEEESADIQKEDKEDTDAEDEEESADIQKEDKEGDDTDSEERVEAHQEERTDIQKDEERGDTQGENVQALKPPKDDYVVGLVDKLTEIKDRLTNRETHLQIITITGMGGIGKTTLAKTVYDAPFVTQHFDIRLWVVVSQNYVREQVLQCLLDSGEKKFFSGGLGASENHTQSGEILSDLLYKGLFNRRYLVVMDDVWSREVWDDLQWFFPAQGNGSRILMTTRDSIVASSLSCAWNINRMDLLNIDNSWKLLCQKAFPQGNGPISELEEVGINIAMGCKGLPLSIVVIGSMLATSPMTREYWESVARDVNSFRNLRDDGHCLKVLSLSLNNLPIHLKACFLYMYIQFLKNSEIDRMLLLRTWITWGLIHPVQHRSKESVADEYFRTLVGRNLILIHESHPNGEVYNCRLHDLIRDLCREEYHKNEFISSPSVLYSEVIAKQTACVLCGEQCGDKEELNFCSLVVITPSSSQVSPFMCRQCTIAYRHIKRLSLVKVMNFVGEYPSQELLHPTRVQSLCFGIPNGPNFLSLSSFVHLLWRLQMLTIWPLDLSTSIVLPSEIWRMPQLKEIIVVNAILTYPSETCTEGKYFIILKNLSKLVRIRKFRCTPEVVCRIPNLRELSICDGDDSDSWVDNSLCNLALFKKLEWLEVERPIFSLSEKISFPNTLKELVLRNTRIPWEDMTMIGSLPNLETLQLQEKAFIGPEWNPTEGQFLRLKVLDIRSHDDLLYWNADTEHFPKLEKLYLIGMHQELGIPDGIRDTPTLKGIYLECCSEYVINSAKQIWEEQREEYGNEDFCVFIKDKDGRLFRCGDER